MNDKPQVLRETDDEARRLARRLLHTAPHVALGVLDPDTGFPVASRVLCATDSDGAPVVLVSALSAHTKGLLADPRCSLLAGEQGKGDPLAYPRVTIQASAAKIEAEDPRRSRLRRRFVLRHPKAELYIDFPDFSFFRLSVEQASLNAGFGRAYRLQPDDLLLPENPADDPDKTEETVLEAIIAERTDLAEAIAKRLGLPTSLMWRLCGFDAFGIDVVATDNTAGGRLEFPEAVTSTGGIARYMDDCNDTIR